MRKILYALIILVLISSSAGSLEKQVIRLGMLTKLNSTEEQFTETWIKTFAPHNEILEVIVKFYDTLTSMQMALNSREINQMVLPDFTADYVMKAANEYTPALVLHSKGTCLAFGFRADSEELRGKFNEALRHLRDNWTLSVLEGIYIASHNIDDPEPVKFAKFDDAETIRVAVTGDLPPIDLIAADGTPSGFNTAVLAEIGAYLKKNIQLVNIEAGARNAALASGRVDVVFWYEIDKSSQVQADVPDGIILSEPYYEWDKFIHIKRKTKESASSSGWKIFNSDFWGLYFNE